jgi:hypothetical protein
MPRSRGRWPRSEWPHERRLRSEWSHLESDSLRRREHGRLHSFALVALCALVLSACGTSAKDDAGSASASETEVTFKASDGVTLDGRIFGEGDVGVVLAHMGRPGDTQADWYRLARVSAPAVERSQTEHEFLELERLREVVVGAELEPGGLVVETVGSGEHEDRHAAAGGDDAFGDLVAGGSGNVSVEDGDVVRVDAQQLQSGVAVACDVCRDCFQAEPIADGFCQIGLVLNEQHTHAPDATSWRISRAYRKPHTCWQHHAALTGGVTYGKRARPTTRRIRIRRIRVAGLLVLIAAIAAALGSQLLGSSPSTATSPIDVLRTEHRAALGFPRLGYTVIVLANQEGANRPVLDRATY